MKRKSVLHEFIDKLQGGNADYEERMSRLKKTAPKLVEDKDVQEFGLPQNTETMPVPLRYKEGQKITSRYLEKFLTDSMETRNKPVVKEDTRMKKVKKSVLSAFLEDLENGRGFVGLGDDDGIVGAPGFKPDAAIDAGSADVAQFGEKLDKERDASSAEDELFGDDRLPGDKDKVAQESFQIKSKKDYTKAVNGLFRNLCEISLLSHLAPTRYGKQEHKIALESYYRAVVKSQKPILWETLSPTSQTVLAKKVAFLQEARKRFLSKSTKKSAKLMEKYLEVTANILKEVDAAMASGTLNFNQAPMASSSGATGVASAFGAAMGALKSKVSTCNQSQDAVARANCQIGSYDEALTVVKGLIGMCGTDELCKAKVMKAVGRLEVMRTNAQNAAVVPPVPAAPPMPPAGMPPVGMPPVGMPPAGMPPAGPAMVVPPVPPVPGEEEEVPPQVAQEMVDLSKSYERAKNRK